MLVLRGGDNKGCMITLKYGGIHIYFNLESKQNLINHNGAYRKGSDLVPFKVKFFMT
jgi:hypothetical protein